MKEKVVLNRPSGEVEERKVVAHFTIADDNRPNIKNIPILILDKKEMNNGNNVLEFMWEKDGVYQAINDENAWSEVKSVVVDIIKNNAKNINYISAENVKADIGPGRSLGLTVAQTDPLIANFKNLVKDSIPAKEETLVEPVSEVSMPVVDTLAPEVTNPVVTDTPVVTEEAPPVFSFPESITNNEPQEEVITPFASNAPAIESVINPPPVIESPVVNEVTSGPEIIPVEKENDFDKMQQEIAAATKEYQEKVEKIIDTYKKKIVDTIKEANSLKEQANDHLKNAQAAEQIATMAYQNSVGVTSSTPSLELQKVA